MPCPPLTPLIALPLIGSFTISLIAPGEKAHQNVKHVGLWTSCFIFLYAVGLIFCTDFHVATPQMVQASAWAFLGIRYVVGLDGISLLFLLLSSFLVMLTILSLWSVRTKHLKSYMSFILLLESLVMGAFLACDGLLFFIFFEATLLPTFFIIGFFGGERRLPAVFKFFLFTLLGSFGLLASLLYIHQAVGSFMLTDIMAHTFTHTEQVWLWLGFFIAFAIKVPMVPVHTWLPDTYTEAPFGGSVLLAGLLSTMGAYGMLRFVLPCFPEANLYFQPLVFTLSVLAIIYGSLVAFAQTNIKRMVAYSSVAHMGIVTLGIFTNNLPGLQGAIFQMLSHGLLSAGLFFMLGFLYKRYKTYDMQEFGGLATEMPLAATFFMILTLGAVGLPGTVGFVGELLTFVGTFYTSFWFALLAASAVVFSALYFLYLYRSIFFEQKVDGLDVTKLKRHEIITLTPIIFLVLLLGIFPSLVLRMTESTGTHLLRLTKQPQTFHQVHPQ